MAPGKFGLFKTRSREQPEQPSTENLLQDSSSLEQVATPESPLPSTSKGTIEDHSPDISVLQLDSDDEDITSEKPEPTRRASGDSVIDDPLMNYHNLTNQSSTENLEDTLALDNDEASTSCDANSLRFDDTSIAPSDDTSVYCMKKNKKYGRRVKEIRLLRDLDMWRASDVEVMQAYLQALMNVREKLPPVRKKPRLKRAAKKLRENLLSRSSNHDEQIKWEAIATARGLCTLTDSCMCGDCARSKYLAGVADGDGGLSAASLMGAVSGCTLQ